MNLHNPLADLPAANQLPTPAPAETPGTPAQRAFREAVQQVEGLRQRLRELRAEQAEARRRYWQHVGPAADAVVQARRALFEPLENALLLGYFSRLEEQQITGVIVGNARALQERFGEDATDVLRRHAPRRRSVAEAESDPDATPPAGEATAPDAHLPPHEQAADRARTRRKTKAQRAEEATAAAARQEQEVLLANTKTLYRQLARLHHPDLARDAHAQQQKTALMQRITEAYETDDLYTLLQLLSDTAPADQADDSLLTRYTQALHRQQTELKQQLHELKFGDHGFMGTSGKKREQEIRAIKRDLRAEAEWLQQVQREIQDPAGLRQLLRELAAEGHDTV